MLLESSEFNFLRPQLFVTISTPVTQYQFLLDFLLSRVIYLMITCHILTTQKNEVFHSGFLQ